jgi:RNA polymerase sigma-70 factor (ECF subfamily)
MFSTRIFHFCNQLLPTKEEAEDVVQKTFMALWEQRKQLDETKDILKYLYTIARYNTYQAFRKHLDTQVSISEHTNVRKLSRNHTEEQLNFSETQHIISEIIEQLPPKRKVIFKLNRIDGLTYREIAVKLNISENTVDTQMRKSLQFLREKYQQFSDE